MAAIDYRVFGCIIRGILEINSLLPWSKFEIQPTTKNPGLWITLVAVGVVLLVLHVNGEVDRPDELEFQVGLGGICIIDTLPEAYCLRSAICSMFSAWL